MLPRQTQHTRYGPDASLGGGNGLPVTRGMPLECRTALADQARTLVGGGRVGRGRVRAGAPASL
jgi:hypothetical protein